MPPPKSKLASPTDQKELQAAVALYAFSKVKCSGDTMNAKEQNRLLENNFHGTGGKLATKAEILDPQHEFFGRLWTEGEGGKIIMKEPYAAGNHLILGESFTLQSLSTAKSTEKNELTGNQLRRIITRVERDLKKIESDWNAEKGDLSSKKESGVNDPDSILQRVCKSPVLHIPLGSRVHDICCNMKSYMSRPKEKLFN